MDKNMLNLEKVIPTSMRSVLIAVSVAALAACDSAELLETSAGVSAGPGTVVVDPVTGNPVDDTVAVDDSGAGGAGADGSGSSDGPDGGTGAEATGNIIETAVNAGSFSTLAAALAVTGLDDVLADESSTFTVFAPTDDAFAALGSETLEELLADPDSLSDLLLGHVIQGNSVSAGTAFDLAGGTVDAANGSSLAISNVDGNLFINGSQVSGTDIATTNGVIHAIDSVILPGQGTVADDSIGSGDAPALANLVDTAFARGGFNRLDEALKATGLDAVLMDDKINFTVFAPTDAAFDALGDDVNNALLADPDTLSNILRYHLIADSVVSAQSAVALAGTTVNAANGEEFALSINDGKLNVNLSEVTTADVRASNGVIHAINKVLAPPAPLFVSGSVVDAAVADGRFNTLAAALQATQLDSVLADQDEVFTVFAPTDDAFAALGWWFC